MSCATDSVHPPLPCLICNGDGGASQFSNCSSNSLISQQLDTIFLLRTILEVPYKLLEGFFGDGDHPSEWGILSLCASCGEEITKCKLLFEEMMEVQRRFKEKKEEIIDKIKRRQRRNSRVPKRNRKIDLREKCLNFVVKNKYTQLTNPFIKGDLQAAELQAVKQEEKEDDTIKGEENYQMEEIGGDLEIMEVEWIVPSDLEEEEDDLNEKEYKEEDKVNEEDSSDSDYKPEENLKIKPSTSISSSPPKIPKKRGGRPKQNKATDDDDSTSTTKIHKKRKLTLRPKNKRGLLPPPPPNNPDPLTLVHCPNCQKTKFQKSRGDLLYNHLIKCIEEIPVKMKGLSWNCPLCENEVTSSSPTKASEHCLRFVEHLNTCQAPDSQKDNEDLEPYPLSFRLFHCDLCYPLQNGPSFILPHFLDHCIFHKKYIYQCTHPQCPPTCRFSTITYLRYHWRAHHSSSDDTSIPFSHTISSTLPTLQFWCSHCHLHFPSEILLNQHLISSHPNSSSLKSPSSLHTCQYCSKGYPSPSLLSIHEISSHLQEKYFLKCPTCSTYHPSIKSLATHEKSREHLKNLQDNPVVDPQGSQICEICGVNCESGDSSDGTTLQKHYRIYHPSKKVRPVRSGRAPKPTNKVDSKGRSLQCPRCNKGFSQLTNLNLHVRTIHEGNWPFYCHSCGKGLPTRPHLKKHLAAQHGEGEYGMLTCQFEGCGKKLFDKEQFQSHVNRHKGEKMFGCEYCGKAFFGVKNLKRHLIIHTNPDDKPFECKLCPHKFRLGGHLKMHMNLHKKKGDC